MKILWWFFRGCSPLPIPNREVKSLMADGTAPQCGRVGSCHIFSKSLNESWGFFVIKKSQWIWGFFVFGPDGFCLTRGINDIFSISPDEFEAFWSILFATVFAPIHKHLDYETKRLRSGLKPWVFGPKIFAFRSETFRFWTKDFGLQTWNFRFRTKNFSFLN